jgi:hypothetical protein
MPDHWILMKKSSGTWFVRRAAANPSNLRPGDEGYAPEQEICRDDFSMAMKEASEA